MLLCTDWVLRIILYCTDFDRNVYIFAIIIAYSPLRKSKKLLLLTSLRISYDQPIFKRHIVTVHLQTSDWKKTENLTNLFNLKCQVKICRSISFLYILHIYEVTGYFSHLHVLICLLIVMPAFIIFIVVILNFFSNVAYGHLRWREQFRYVVCVI